MIIKQVSFKGNPPMTNVVCIDPANHTGLIGGSLAGDALFWKVFKNHKDKHNLLNDALIYRHPNPQFAEIAKDKTRGSGVFVVTKDQFVFATVRGTTQQALNSIFRLVEHYLQIPPMVIIERPLPANSVLCQSAGYIAGGLCFTFNTEPVLLPPHRFKNPEKVFNGFLRRYGVRYDNPTPHEMDAALLYVSLLFQDEYKTLEQEPDCDCQPIRECVGTVEDYLDPATLPSAVSVKKPEVQEFFATLLEALGKRLNLDMRSQYEMLCRKDRNLRKVRLL